MRKLRHIKRLPALLGVFALSVLSVAAVAIADNLVADGDGIAPVTDSNMNVGAVNCGVPKDDTALLAVRRNGNYANSNAFKAGSTVTISVVSVSGSGLSASVPSGSGNQITLPGDWATVANNTMSSAVSSTVTVASSSPGPGSGSVTYRATGVDPGGSSLSREDTMNVSWTTGNNCAPADTTAPTSSASAKNADDSAYSFGDWTNQNVAVTLTGADETGGSGLKEIRYTTNGTDPTASNGTVYGSPFTVSSEGTTTIKWRAIDNTGNLQAVQSQTVKIDKTAPVISRDADSDNCALPGTNGWCRGEQTAGFSASDALSGLVGQASPYKFTKSTTDNGSAVSISSGTLKDNAGNEAVAISAGPFKIDSVGPSVSVTGVANNGSYTLGSVPAAGCQTSDSLSDVADVATVAVTGGTVNGVGTFTATCSGAKDNAGNPQSAPVSVSYKVGYGGVSGILQPINPDNSSVFSRGRAVPVKFQLAGDPPAFVTTGWSLKRVQVNCAAMDEDVISENVDSITPSTVFRYDSTGDQYIYNADFRDKAAGTCWKVQVTLDDGTVLTSAVFKLQK